MYDDEAEAAYADVVRSVGQRDQHRADRADCDHALTLSIGMALLRETKATSIHSEIIKHSSGPTWLPL